MTNRTWKESEKKKKTRHVFSLSCLGEIISMSVQTRLQGGRRDGQINEWKNGETGRGIFYQSMACWLDLVDKTIW